MQAVLPLDVIRFAALVLVLTLPGYAQSGAGLRLTVKEGEGAINNIRAAKAKEPIVEVTDASGRPVTGASVVFLLPELGPSGIFAASGSTMSVLTGSDGIAVGRGLKPNNVAGEFEIRIVASFQGRTARATVRQTNVAPQKAGASGGGKTALIVALLGGAGAAVALGVTRSGGGGNPNPAGPSSTVISPGGSSFGPPR